MTPEEKAEIIAAVKSEVYAEAPGQLAVGGFFQVSPGQTILADHMNTALVNGVPKFASLAALMAAWPSPPQGAMAYINDQNYFGVFDAPVTGGTPDWRALGSYRMGYAQMGQGQVIQKDVVTNLRIGTTGGAANQAGRAVWTANAEYVVVPMAGTYLCVGDITWPSNATGARLTYVQRAPAGTTSFGFDKVSGGVQEDNIAGPSPLRQTVTALVACGLNDRIALRGAHSAGVPLTLGTGYDSASLAVHFMGAD